MDTQTHTTISVLVPAYNEAANIPVLYTALTTLFDTLPYTLELVFIDDGSTDTTEHVIRSHAARDARVLPIIFSRNFGKEAATTAGLASATGDAVILMDADMQHPPRMIPEFLKKWEEGFEQVVGVRKNNAGQGITKTFLSRLFYRIMRRISDVELVPGETDFRLLDRQVVDAFNALHERQRMVRTLLNWVGFKRTEIAFVADERAHGNASYSTVKLIRLALHSFISNSLLPLRAAGYLGVVTIIGSFMLGFIVFVQRYIFKDVLEWHVSGSAQLAILVVFLIGIVLAALGLIALYIETIHADTAQRPLYIVRKK